jgi:hypothetical protein
MADKEITFINGQQVASTDERVLERGHHRPEISRLGLVDHRRLFFFASLPSSLIDSIVELVDADVEPCCVFLLELFL